MYFSEFLEFGPTQDILPNQSTYFRYIDGDLSLHPHVIVLPDFKLNEVEHTLKFTYEKEIKLYLT